PFSKSLHPPTHHPIVRHAYFSSEQLILAEHHPQIAFDRARMKPIPIRQLKPVQAEAPVADHFNIRSIEEVLGGKDMVQDLHRHDHYFLLAMTHGAGVHEVDFTPHTLKARGIYFMRPGQVHRLRLQAASTGYIMQFRSDFYAPGEKSARLVLRKAGGVGIFLPNAERYGELLVTLDRMHREYTNKEEGYLHIIRAHLGVLLVETILRAPGPVDPCTASPYAHERLDELLELIEENVYQVKEVSAYAEMMHLSTFQLNAIAKAGMGRTTSELITDQIILEAKRYLLATSDQVNQVADRLGYEDVSYFIRFFKKRTGHTPEGFRQKSR
ncbi:MAG: AraC family transcriptional regulator, partial [Flavobacteriales bacterium]|nr:AraC family transcriptional regulator [Flavobacteriales bacterium]